MNAVTLSGAPPSGHGARRDRIVIAGGHLLTMDRHVPDGPGSIVVHDGTIVAVGPDPAPDLVAGCDVIDAAGSIVMPGLVDTHRHTWQSAIRHIGTDWSLDDYFGAVFFGMAPHFRPADAGSGTLLGALGALDAGITTLVDWSHIQSSPDHSDACIEALQASGIRAVFAYGWPQDDPARYLGEAGAELPHDIQRVRSVLADDRARITMAMAARGPEMSGFDAAERDLRLARELDLAVTMHIGVGEYGPKVRGVEWMSRAGYLDARTTLVHACTCGADELAMASAVGATASVSPLIEMTMAGIGAPATGRLRAAGIRTGLSVDSETSTSGDMFTQMRSALAQHRRAEQSGESDLLGDDWSLTAHDLLAMATIDGATVAGVADRTGSLTPGKRADVIVVAADGPGIAPALDPVQAIVLGAHPGLVHTVVADGVIAKRHGRLTGPVARAIDGAVASLDHLRSATSRVLG